MFFSSNLLSIGTILSGGLQAAANIAEGKRTSDAFEFNAAVLQQKAILIGEKAKLDLERQRKAARTFTAKQTAAFAASGVRLTGSPLQVLQDSAAQLELDILITDFNSKIDIFSALSEAKFQLQRAQIAERSSFIKAGASLLNILPSFGKLKFSKKSTSFF